MDDMMMDKDEKKVKKMKQDRLIGAVLMAIILPIYGWLLVDPSDMINGRAYHVFHEKTGFWMLVSWLEWLYNLFEFTIGYLVISKSNMRCFDCIDSLRWVFNLIWVIVGIESASTSVDFSISVMGVVPVLTLIRKESGTERLMLLVASHSGIW